MKLVPPLLLIIGCATYLAYLATAQEVPAPAPGPGLGGIIEMLPVSESDANQIPKIRISDDSDTPRDRTNPTSTTVDFQAVGAARNAGQQGNTEEGAAAPVEAPQRRTEVPRSERSTTEDRTTNGDRTTEESRDSTPDQARAPAPEASRDTAREERPTASLIIQPRTQPRDVSSRPEEPSAEPRRDTAEPRRDFPGPSRTDTIIDGQNPIDEEPAEESSTPPQRTSAPPQRISAPPQRTSAPPRARPPPPARQSTPPRSEPTLANPGKNLTRADLTWAEPRGNSSGLGEDYMNFFQRQHDEYVSEKESAAFPTGRGYEVVFYGDSLFQCMRYPSDTCKGAQEAWKKYIAPKYRAVNWAIGSDTIESLMWRLIHGERPKNLGTEVVLFAIGVNDVGTWDDRMSDINSQILAERIVNMSVYLTQSEPDINVVFVGLLPRGPGEAGMYSQPSRFTRINQLANGAVQDAIQDNSMLHFLDCSYIFYDNNGDIRREYMPDALHPSGRGYELFVSDCMLPLINELSSGTKYQDAKQGAENAPGSPASNVAAPRKQKQANQTNLQRNRQLARQRARTQQQQQQNRKQLAPQQPTLQEPPAADALPEGYYWYDNPTGNNPAICRCASPYDLKAGTSFDVIASKCGVSVSGIAEANNIDFSTVVDVGTSILIPGCGGRLRRRRDGSDIGLGNNP